MIPPIFLLYPTPVTGNWCPSSTVLDPTYKSDQAVFEIFCLACSSCFSRILYVVAFSGTRCSRLASLRSIHFSKEPYFISQKIILDIKFLLLHMLGSTHSDGMSLLINPFTYHNKIQMINICTFFKYLYVYDHSSIILSWNTSLPPTLVSIQPVFYHLLITSILAVYTHYSFWVLTLLMGDLEYSMAVI